MITTPHRRSDAEGAAAATCPHGCAQPAGTVTAEQVASAIAQLRERPGRSAAEHVQAVMRAFNLTVASDQPIPRPR